MTGSTVRFLIADDHLLVRRGLRHIIERSFKGADIGEAANVEEVMSELRKTAYDLLILDINMPGRSGLEALDELRDYHIPVLMLSMHPEDRIAVRALKSGASGYLTKDSAPEQLAEAIHKILAGGKFITPNLAEQLLLDVQRPSSALPHEALSNREFEIIRMIASGKAVGEIALDLCLSVKTVSTYRARALSKLGFVNNAQLTSYAIKHGLVG